MEIAYEGNISHEKRLITPEDAKVSSAWCLCGCPDQSSFSVNCDIRDSAMI